MHAEKLDRKAPIFQVLIMQMSSFTPSKSSQWLFGRGLVPIAKLNQKLPFAIYVSALNSFPCIGQQQMV